MKLKVEIQAKSKREILKHLLTIFKLLLDDQESQTTVAYAYKLSSSDTPLDWNKEI